MDAAGWVCEPGGLSATLESSGYRVVAWCFGGWDIFKGSDIVVAGPALPLLGATLPSAATSATSALASLLAPCVCGDDHDCRAVGGVS